MRRSWIRRPLQLLATVVTVAILTAVSVQLGAQGGGRERTIFVSAVDRSGKPVDGLTPADFVVREDGARREVLRVSRAVEAMDVALLVDNSASSSALIVPLREGLKRFVSALLMADGAPRHNIALVGLAARPTIVVDYTSDQKRLNDGIGRLFPEAMSGMTLLDAIVEVSAGLDKRETSRAVIVPIITDGVEFTNRDYRDVIGAMTRTGAALHALTIGTFSVTDDDAIRNRALVLDEGARTTGGQRITLLSTSAVPTALEKLAAELTAQYKVVYGRPESLIPAEKLQVSAGRAGITMRAAPARERKAGV
jgi:VWFA-related protein